MANGDGLIRFSVIDKGLGIPPSEHRRIFEKFYRLDPDMTRGIGGTGLGLYICRELVRRMDGKIWVESTLGQGIDVRRRAARRGREEAAEDDRKGRLKPRQSRTGGVRDDSDTCQRRV